MTTDINKLKNTKVNLCVNMTFEELKFNNDSQNTKTNKITQKNI
jgi:hypothetical protein